MTGGTLSPGAVSPVAVNRETAESEAVNERRGATGRQAGEEAGRPVDGGRFRMLFTITGCGPHEEDEWEGRLLRVGEVLVRVGLPVPRCAVTSVRYEPDFSAVHSAWKLPGVAGTGVNSTFAATPPGPMMCASTFASTTG